ncbi:MAG: hypothetical protein AAB611_03455, partial [Patescibacteria group bacterium]
MNTNYTINREVPTQSVATLLLISLLAWTVGFSVFTQINRADAAALMNISDTMTESRVSQVANHNIVFQVSSSMSQSQTITLGFASFGITNIGFADIDIRFGSTTSFNASTSVFTSVTSTSVGATASIGRWGVATSSGNIVLTAATAQSYYPLNTNYVQVLIGTNASELDGTSANQISNPSSVGSYPITVVTSAGDTGEARVAITAAVTMSGSVSSTLQMVVSDIASGIAVWNGAVGTTDVATTGTTIPWGVITSSTVAAGKLAAQKLAVQTNANNGFIVKVRQTQNFQSSAYGA